MFNIYVKYLLIRLKCFVLHRIENVCDNPMGREIIFAPNETPKMLSSCEVASVFAQI